ncbi:MAG: GAF domain-containing protein, partial [Halanaeroarchaeum sp.]
MEGAKLVDDLSTVDRRSDTGETTIQVLANDDGNRRALADLLAGDFTVITSMEVGDADLYLVDNQVMPTYHEPLREHVKSSHPVFVPVVVVRRPDESRAVDHSDAVPENGPVLVDAELEAPVTRRVLVRRIHSLLARRNQSIQHRDREERIKHLLEATRSVMETDDREDVVQFTADVTRNILGFSSNVIRLLEDDVFVPVVVSQRATNHMGTRPDYPNDPHDNPVARAFARGEPMVYPNFDQLEDGYDRHAARSGMYVPIGEYGVLSVVEAERQAFDRSDVGFASVLATNAKSALDRIEYEERLQRRERTEQII